jgi:uncharacterized membrane protein
MLLDSTPPERKTFPLLKTRLSWLGWVTLVAVTLGLGLRCWNVDLKPLWIDEAFTLLHLAGYSDPHIEQIVWAGRPLTPDQLLPFQIPTAANSWGSMVTRIAQTAPELPPLYFSILREWGLQMGPSIRDSLTSLRWVSVGCGALLLPLVYWLSWELFSSATVGAIAVSLVALSPFQMVYSQDMRPYTLWGCFVLAGTAALVRAVRLSHVLWWGLYVLLGTLGLYTHLMTSLIWIAHAIAVLISRCNLRVKTAFGLSSGLAGLAFFPWLWLCWTHRYSSAHVVNSLQVGDKPTVGTLLKSWIQILSNLFADFNVSPHSPGWTIGLYGVFSLLLILLCARAIWQLHPRSQRLRQELHDSTQVPPTRDSRTPAHTGHTQSHTDTLARWNAWLTTCLIAVPFLTIILSDLILQSTRSINSRYLLPSLVLLTIALAASLAPALQQHTTRRLTRFGLMALLTLSLLSSWTYATTADWRSKGDDRFNPAIAQILSQAKQPNILCSEFFIHPLALAHVVPPNTQFYLARLNQLPPNLPSQFFVHMPKPEVLQALSPDYDLKPVIESNRYTILVQAQRKGKL